MIPTPYQACVLAALPTANLTLSGTRAGGRTTAAMFLCDQAMLKGLMTTWFVQTASARVNLCSSLKTFFSTVNPGVVFDVSNSRFYDPARKTFLYVCQADCYTSLSSFVSDLMVFDANLVTPIGSAVFSRFVVDGSSMTPSCLSHLPVNDMPAASVTPSMVSTHPNHPGVFQAGPGHVIFNPPLQVPAGSSVSINNLSSGQIGVKVYEQKKTMTAICPCGISRMDCDYHAF